MVVQPDQVDRRHPLAHAHPAHHPRVHPRGVRSGDTLGMDVQRLGRTQRAEARAQLDHLAQLGQGDAAQPRAAGLDPGQADLERLRDAGVQIVQHHRVRHHEIQRRGIGGRHLRRGQPAQHRIGQHAILDRAGQRAQRVEAARQREHPAIG